MKEAEDIIISKRFFELTPEEFEVVKEFAANEEDYDAMRWFLQSTRQAFEKEKIEVGPGLRKNIMTHLEQRKPAKMIWLNSAGAFLFPKEKKFYQYPAFQVAAVGLLLVGLVFMYEGGMNADQQLALNTNGKEEMGPMVTEADDQVPAEISPESETEKERDQSPAGGQPESELADNRSENGPGGSFGPLMDEPVDLATGSASALNKLAVPEVGELKDMSVADEVRITESMNMNYADGSWGYTNSYRPDTFSGIEYKIPDANLSGALLNEQQIAVDKETGNSKKNEGRAEKQRFEDENALGDADLTGTPAQPANTVETTTVVSGGVVNNQTGISKEELEGEPYTTYYWNVYSTDSTKADDHDKSWDATKPDADEPANQVSIGQSKELKALFFTVR